MEHSICTIYYAGVNSLNTHSKITGDASVEEWNLVTRNLRPAGIVTHNSIHWHLQQFD